MDDFQCCLIDYSYQSRSIPRSGKHTSHCCKPWNQHISSLPLIHKCCLIYLGYRGGYYQPSSHIAKQQRILFCLILETDLQYVKHQSKIYAANLRRRKPITPAIALPNNQTAPGTGTGELVSDNA